VCTGVTSSFEMWTDQPETGARLHCDAVEARSTCPVSTAEAGVRRRWQARHVQASRAARRRSPVTSLLLPGKQHLVVPVVELRRDVKVRTEHACLLESVRLLLLGGDPVRVDGHQFGSAPERRVASDSLG
jgi:hypothetical protein